MKKIILLIAAAMLFGAAAQAQNYFNVGYGNCDNITSIDGIDPTHKTTNEIFGGVSHNFCVYKNFGVEAGINYVYDFSSKTVGSIENSKINTRYHGLMVPVEINYQFPIDNFTLKVFAGPAFNYGFSSKLTTIIAGKEISTIDHFENDSVKRFMVQATGGVTAELSQLVRIKVGYSYCLADYDKIDVSELHENMVYVTVGLMF